MPVDEVEGETGWRRVMCRCRMWPSSLEFALSSKLVGVGSQTCVKRKPAIYFFCIKLNLLETGHM